MIDLINSDVFCYGIVFVLAILVARFFSPKPYIHPRRPSMHHKMSPNQAAAFLSHTFQQNSHNANRDSGEIDLPRMGFDSFDEKMTAIGLLARKKEHLDHYNININYDLDDIERVWREGIDRSQ